MEFLTFFNESFLGTPVWFWAAFTVLVIGILVFDLGVLHRDDHEIGAKESFILYGCYVGVAIAFGIWVWFVRGGEAGLQFFTGYVIEQSLSMDNIFVIATIFGFIGVPRALQHRVLFWGIIGVVVLRAILIGVGVALVVQFQPILFLFGAFLVFTGIRMFWSHESSESDMDNNVVLKFLRKRFRITDSFHGHHFMVRQPHPRTGKLVIFLTPLAVALIMVEAADVIFAVDSVPAIFAITQDPFIIYTSNIFAILGLRSLYFALSAAMNKFRYLSYALAFVLVFIGVKIFLVPLHIHIPTPLSLGVTLGALAAGIGYSLWKTRNEPPKGPEEDPSSGHLVP